MKRLIATSITICLVLISGLSVASAKANFTGTWKLDQSKSEGVTASTPETTMRIQHEGDKVTVEIKFVTPQGERLQNDIFMLDGKETEYTPANQGGSAKGKRTTKWTADGTGFVASEDESVTSQDGNSRTTHATKKYLLSADGKAISFELTRAGQNGAEVRFKGVFTKE